MTVAVAVVTGSAGLIGSQAAAHFASTGLPAVGIDNDMRRVFFGDESSTAWMVTELERTLGDEYTHADVDIRDRANIDALFAEYGSDISLVIHTAAQPSHDWAEREPFTDFVPTPARVLRCPARRSDVGATPTGSGRRPS